MEKISFANQYTYCIKLLLSYIFINLTIISYSQIPNGGINVVSPLLSGHSFWDASGNGIKTIETVTGQSFNQAVQLKTNGNPANTWDQQLSLTEINGVEAGDVILFTFWGKVSSSTQETGAGFVMLVVENANDYSKELFTTVTLTNEWQQYYVSFKAVQTLTASQLNIAFHSGFTQQTIQLAEVQVLNYKNTKTLAEMPFTVLTYSGRDLNDPWRVDAQSRINQYRKGDLQIRVTDKNSVAIEGVNVSIKMIEHKFGFGTAVNAETLLNNQQYRDTAFSLFNEFTIENDMKWWLYIYPYRQSNSRQAVDLLLENNKRIRGHNILWPSFNAGYSPTFLSAYKTDPAGLRNQINMHIDDIVTQFKGDLIDWDVINEPYDNHDYMDILGYGEMAAWYNRTHAIDPLAKLFLNDYSILAAGGLDIARQDAYYNTISKIINDGGHIDGIGMQSHFSTQLTPITRVYSILNRYATLNKDIKITEFDVSVGNQFDVQSDYTRDFMTMIFSHPSVTSFVMWGFWESSHWKPEAAMYRTDWSAKQNLVEYKKLVFKDWWTPKYTSDTDNDGLTSIDRVFLGDYEISVQYSGVTYIDTIKVGSNSQLNQSTIILNTLVTSLQSNLPVRFSVYPNPTSTSYTIEFVEGMNQVEVYSVTGQLLYRKEVLSSEYTFGQDLQPGMYILKVNDQSLKIIKQ